jgi:hypothetical protein
LAVSGDFGGGDRRIETKTTTLGGLGAAERGKFGALVFVCVSAVVLGAAALVLRRFLVC